MVNRPRRTIDGANTCLRIFCRIGSLIAGAVSAGAGKAKGEGASYQLLSRAGAQIVDEPGQRHGAAITFDFASLTVSSN
jgi:hypothetical protein